MKKKREGAGYEWGGEAYVPLLADEAFSDP